MSVLAIQPHSESGTAEDCVSAESLDELQEANARLQLLICELLVKNQKLRFRLAAE
jgi:hypothetical protein